MRTITDELRTDKLTSNTYIMSDNRGNNAYTNAINRIKWLKYRITANDAEFNYIEFQLQEAFKDGVKIANELNAIDKPALHKQNVTNRTFWQTLKSTFIPPKNWNIIQCGVAYLYFVSAIVFGIKLILLLFGYGW